MEKTFFVLNGREKTEKEIPFKKLKRGFLYGDGIFETLKAENARIFRWDDHWERFLKGAYVCNLRIGEKGDKLKKEIEGALLKHNSGSAYVRVNAWRKETDSFDPGDERGVNILVLTREYMPYPADFYKEGIRCMVSKRFCKNEKSPLVYVKSLNYLENIMAKREAKEKGYDDNILLNTAGYLASASVSNLFFVKGKRLFTPSVECGILQGVTRKVLFEICGRTGIRIEEGKFRPSDLITADEVFLTNTLMGIMPVRGIRGIFKGKEFSFSDFLRDELGKIEF